MTRHAFQMTGSNHAQSARSGETLSGENIVIKPHFETFAAPRHSSLLLRALMPLLVLLLPLSLGRRSDYPLPHRARFR